MSFRRVTLSAVMALVAGAMTVSAIRGATSAAGHGANVPSVVPQIVVGPESLSYPREGAGGPGALGARG